MVGCISVLPKCEKGGSGIMKGIGLVFAGGGGKGSYEIGVWKYLHEIGLDQYVRAVSGTSVGALNAALFAGSSYELAEELWLNISQEKILTPKEVSAEDIMKWLVANGVALSLPMLRGVSKVVSGTVLGVEKIAQIMFAKLMGDHMFSREGIVEMISDGLDFNRLRSSELPCFVTCVRCPGLIIKRFRLNAYSDDDITKVLLASSAIPIIFPNEEFQGEKYCDGGIPIVGDNVPVEPVYNTGVEHIIVVHLSQDALVDKEQFPNSNIIEIVPHEDLGNALSGTLDFSSEGALMRLQLGYEDAKRIMQPMVDMIIMKAANQNMLKVAQQTNIEYEKERQGLIKEENSIKEKMARDGFDALFENLTKENK